MSLHVWLNIKISKLCTKYHINTNITLFTVERIVKLPQINATNLDPVRMVELALELPHTTNAIAHLDTQALIVNNVS